MKKNRIKELAAMFLIGESMLGLFAPRRHMLLWRFGPRRYQAFVERFADRARLGRLLYAGQLAGGIFLAQRALGRRHFQLETLGRRAAGEPA